MQRIEVKMVGVGGQGVRLAGTILGTAATLEGKHASAWSSYGIETRGGPSVSEVIVSDTPIDYPRVVTADVLTATDGATLQKHLPNLAAKGTLIVDSNIRLVNQGDVTVRRFPALRIACECVGSVVASNIVMLAFVVEAAKVVDAKRIEEAIRKCLSVGSVESNLRAFRVGLRSAASV
ncbi:MAG: 2-oxoacid:acceptor oxidoreductase family protein [Candidatus Bathyarchaeia archaeon]